MTIINEAEIARKTESENTAVAHETSSNSEDRRKRNEEKTV